MELNQNILTCLMKDDISSLLLAYRKFAGTNYDIIGIQTAYDRRNQRFILTQEITKHFSKLACIGPVPIYEDYVTMANFPYDMDLNDYAGNVIHLDIIDHLKNHHLDDICPKQQTVYHPKFQVDKKEFESVTKNIDLNTLNIIINIFDPQHDSDFSIIYDVIFCINALKKEFDLPVTIYNAGIIHADFTDRVYKAVEDELGFEAGVNFINICDQNLSQQIAYMLHSDLVLSGSYGLGFLAYMVRAPACIIFPYNMLHLVGKTISKERNTDTWYLETTDEDVLSNLGNITQIARRAYDRNRNSNL